MRFDKFSFGSIRIDGVTYENDVVIDRGKVRKRNQFARGDLLLEEWQHRRFVFADRNRGRDAVFEKIGNFLRGSGGGDGAHLRLRPALGVSGAYSTANLLMDIVATGTDFAGGAIYFDMNTNLRPSSECSGSSSVIDIGSSKTVTASSKETRCLRTLFLAFASSHSKPVSMASADQA